MIVCPNCSHPNPDSAVQCEACYTPLPALTTCPSCGAAVQADASFCGQCGFDLRATSSAATPVAAGQPGPNAAPDLLAVPDLMPPDPLITPEPLPLAELGEPSPAIPPEATPTPPAPETPLAPVAPAPATMPPTPAPAGHATTQLQVIQAKLLHIQTNAPLELPSTLSVIHIGKPNDRVPPDIDVAGFPDSEIVSRVHANIRVEGDSYYLEDVGSSNGTYVNNMPLSVGNRHRLRAGDRISLGKGDKVSFLFQVG